MSHWSLEKTSDGSRTLRSQRFAQSCHSSSGARSETLYVSLHLSGVAERLQRGIATRVLEVGFGTGLALLLTVDAARRAGAVLEYFALERDLLDAAPLRALRYEQVLERPELARALASALQTRGANGDLCGSLDDGVRFDLRLGDAVARVRELAPESFDACYLDPFSPEGNPELWTEEFLASIAAALRPGARLSTN